MAHLTAAAVFLHALPAPFGDGATALDTVSVTLVSADDLARPQLASEAASTPPPAIDATATPEPLPPHAKPPTTSLEVTAHEADVVVPTGLLDTSILRDAPVIPVVARSAPAEAVVAVETTPVAAAAAATASVTTEAAVSQGAVDRFVRDVALAIGKARPAGVGQKGRVEIEFTLADTGRAAARVVRSSGSTRLDGLALAAIERATYPAPPTGMSAKQLTYRVPFAFE